MTIRCWVAAVYCPSLMKRVLLFMMILVATLSFALTFVRATFVEFNREFMRLYASFGMEFTTDPALDVFPDITLLQDFHVPTDPTAPSFVRCTDIPDEPVRGPEITMTVAISQCFKDTTVAAIEEWVAQMKSTKLIYRQNDKNSELKFAFALISTLCSNNAIDKNPKGNTPEIRLAAFKKHGTILQTLQTTKKNLPDAFLAFVNTDLAFQTIQLYEQMYSLAITFNVQLCDEPTECTFIKQSSATYLAKLSDLTTYRPLLLVKRYTCDELMTNSVPVEYKDSSGNTACVCLCPLGFERQLSGNGAVYTCVKLDTIKSISGLPSCEKCVWDSYGAFRHEVDVPIQECIFTHPLTTFNLPVPFLKKNIDTDTNRRVIVSFRQDFLPIYDATAVSAAIQDYQQRQGLARQDAIDKKVRPLRLPTWAVGAFKSARLPSSAHGPLTQISNAWSDYQISKRSLIDQELLFAGGLGKYTIEITATDGKAQTTCHGCLAITDQYRPQATTKCPVSFCKDGDGPQCTVPKDEMTRTNVQKANTAIQAFYKFQSNAKNDACSKNSRCDAEVFALQQFFQDSYAENQPYPDGRECFSPDKIWIDFLAAARSQRDPFQDNQQLQQITPIPADRCTRCCRLSVQLKEKWIDYLCDSDYDTEKCEGLPSEQCSLIQCLVVSSGDALVTATAAIRESVLAESKNVLQAIGLDATGEFETYTQIHRVVSCIEFDTKPLKEGECSFQTTLLDLIDIKSELRADFIGSSGNRDATGLVFWRYKINGDVGGWRRIDDVIKYMFREPTTEIVLESWTHCGLVKQFLFTVHIHLETPIKVCDRFEWMWYQTTATELLSTNAVLCNLPQSDFVELTFDYEPNMGLKTSNTAASTTTISSVICSANFDKHSPVEILAVTPQPTNQRNFPPILHRFAVELVNDPMTVPFSFLHVSCAFTYTKYDRSTTQQTCTKSFVMMSCDAPVFDTPPGVLQCQHDDCAGRDQPGPYEACGGYVLKATAQGKTVLETDEKVCCSSCQQKDSHVCASILHEPNPGSDLKRCVPRDQSGGYVRGDKATTPAYTQTAFDYVTHGDHLLVPDAQEHTTFVSRAIASIAGSDRKHILPILPFLLIAVVMGTIVIARHFVNRNRLKPASPDIDDLSHPLL